jgi:hypothetical protein
LASWQKMPLSARPSTAPMAATSSLARTPTSIWG